MVFMPISPTFQAETQTFDHGGEQRRRVTAVRGYIADRKTPRNVRYALSAVWPGGQQRDANIPNTEAGHLIPLELAGADSVYNLVPMYGAVNRGTYRAAERSLRGILVPGQQAAALVVCTYSPFEPDQRNPAYIEIYASGNVVDLTTVTPTPQFLVATVMNAKSEPAQWDLSGPADVNLRAALLQAKAAFNPAHFDVADVLGIEGDARLPPKNQRPNAWVDWLIYSRQHLQTAQALLSMLPGNEEPTIGGCQDFSDSQKLLLQICNRYTQPDPRKGCCYSDVPSDPIKSALTALGTEDGIHVDHIVPMTPTGWNVYSNAAITSSKYNVAKGRSAAAMELG